MCVCGRGLHFLSTGKYVFVWQGYALSEYLFGFIFECCGILDHISSLIMNTVPLSWPGSVAAHSFSHIYTLCFLMLPYLSYSIIYSVLDNDNNNNRFLYKRKCIWGWISTNITLHIIQWLLKKKVGNFEWVHTLSFSTFSPWRYFFHFFKLGVVFPVSLSSSDLKYEIGNNHRLKTNTSEVNVNKSLLIWSTQHSDWVG